MAGGDASNYYLSYSYIYKGHKEEANVISEQVKATWTSDVKIVVHWDNKIMNKLDSSGKEKRLPVVISGSKGSKLLEAPSIGSSLKGIYRRKTAESVVKLLEDWSCGDDVFGCVFDTTASNTVRLNGACLNMQKLLNRTLLWFPCRHHIGELIVNKVLYGT